MNITLKHTEVRNLELKRIDEEAEEDDINFSFSVGFNEELKNSFIIAFDYYVFHKEERFSLKIDYVAYFNTDEEISKEFKDSHFPLVNAPAIAYPFLRSFIGTLTVNAGYGAFIIPTVNFQKLANEKS